MVGFEETIKRVVGVTTEEDTDGFTWLRVEVVTAGNIRKVVRFPHYWADVLRTQLECTIGLMDNDTRCASWAASAPGKVKA